MGQINPKEERYTPASYIKLVKLVLGEIDLDPASTAIANKTVQAKEFYTLEDDGLSLPWNGRIWINPPYSIVYNWAEKLLEEISLGHTTQAILLVNACSDTAWFQMLAQFKSLIPLFCFVKGRINFDSPDEAANLVSYTSKKNPRYPSVFVHFGNDFDSEVFKQVFSKIGSVMSLCR